jgi:hypothetical protein
MKDKTHPVQQTANRTGVHMEILMSQEKMVSPEIGTQARKSRFACLVNSNIREGGGDKWDQVSRTFHCS